MNSENENVATDDLITIVIVNYNSGEWLSHCTDGLQRQTFKKFSVIIVDNASSDSSMEACAQLGQRFKIIRLDSNVGFAAANNLAASKVNTPWIAMLNPDAIPQEHWVETLAEAAQRHKDVTMFGSTQLMAVDPRIIDGAGDVYSPLGFFWRGEYGHSIKNLPPHGYVFAPCAAAAMYRTDVFRNVGGFDERFFCYCEDVDLAFRIRLLGHKCVQVKDAVVHHGSSVICGRKSSFTIYHGFRNRLWTFIKNQPTLLLAIFLIPHIVITFLLIVTECGGGQFRAALQGFLDGLKGIPKIWKSRTEIQNSRRITLKGLVSSMTFSPIKMFNRSHDVKILP